MPRVSLFIPCFVDQLFPETGKATVELLRRAGCEVSYNPEQTCCGQPAFNSGFHHETRQLATKFLRLFADSEFVVAPSASCVAMVRTHFGDLGLEPQMQMEWENQRNRVYELSEFLVDVLGVLPETGSFPYRVAYHSSCHGLRELEIHAQPMRLLHSVRDIDICELQDRNACCGFGGTFASKFSSLSAAIGEDKLDAISRSGADVVTATDDSCLMHIQGLAKRRGLPIRSMHYARILIGEKLA